MHFARQSLLWKKPCFGVCQFSILIFPNQTGTATSSPVDNQPSRVDIVIPHVMLWMMKNAYANTQNTEVAKGRNSKNFSSIKVYPPSIC